MHIQKVTNNINFGSKNSPVIPFSINTSSGLLNVEEIKEGDLANAGEFYYNTMALQEGHIKESTPDFEKKLILSGLKNYQKRVYKKPDGNSTILAAKDTNNDIKGLFSMHSFDEFENTWERMTDLRTGHVSQCVLSPEYRANGTGTIILKKLLITAKGYFTDIFLEAKNQAVSFYEKSGFKALDISIPDIKTISSYILENRHDRNEITLMSLPLDELNPCWKRLIKYLQ